MGLLDNRTAVITGASRGIGRGIALALAKEGANIVVNYNSSADAANEVVAAAEAMGVQAMAVQANVADLEQATTLLNDAKKAYGTVDILVNNAGVTRDNIIMMMAEEDWDTVLNTNLKSAWNCSKAAAKIMMRKKYGRIINITSVSGIAGQGGQSNYAASKAGMIGLTKSVAKELAARNITANAVAPGFIDTDMTAALGEDMLAEVDKAIPLGRRGSVEDVAYAVAFLASEQASYITGQVLSVDGGLVMG